MADPLSEAEFEKIADEELRAISSSLDALQGDFEADLESGILTIEFSDGVKYVVNSHRAARQIWMAAERNAWHFDFTRGDRGAAAGPGTHGTWRATKTDDELWSTVEAVLGRKLETKIALARG